ncbi:MAG: two-component sensor histidine kinase [Myxococcales bacterium]|nr:two-component sensor histidine kinase [Myxococcales bacterium]
MNVRGLGDEYALQRLLWLLVATVIVPTILLSLFGVMAIRNQRAAILQRLDDDLVERLAIAARGLRGVVDDFESAAVARADACTDAALDCALEVAGAERSWRWHAEDPVPEELRVIGAGEARIEGTDVVWVTPSSGAAPVAMLARGDVRLSWRVDPAAWIKALTARVGHRLPSDTQLVLEPPAPGWSSAMEEAIARLSAPRRDQLALVGPLAGWRLRVAEQDPTRAVIQRNSWVYALSLVLLVTLVLVGAVVTLGAAAREIRLSRLQTDFVSGVSHDLRTPLTSIRLFVETLQSGRLREPAKVEECLDLLALETDRLSRMIERVLDWARMEAGRRVYDFEPVEAAELASAALRALRSHHLLSDDPIDVQVEPDLPALSVDRDAIVEALLNLLQNAVKYTPPPRRITLRAQRQGRGVALVVSDNGPGIPRREWSRIFEKFYQVDARLSTPSQGRVDRGSGLGLSIVRAVARAHGGRVRVQSEVGRGSRFILWLPVATVQSGTG